MSEDRFAKLPANAVAVNQDGAWSSPQVTHSTGLSALSGITTSSPTSRQARVPAELDGQDLRDNARQPALQSELLPNMISLYSVNAG